MPKANFSAVVNKKAELYLWDQHDGNFLKQANIHASISKPPSPTPAFDYIVMAVTLEGQQLLKIKLKSMLNAQWSQRLTSLTWKHKSPKGIISSWCFKFKNLKDLKEFQKARESCLFKTFNRGSWESAGEHQYGLNSYDSGEGTQNVDDDDDDDDVSLGAGTLIFGSNKESEDPDDYNDEEDSDYYSDEDTNLEKDALGFGSSEESEEYESDESEFEDDGDSGDEAAIGAEDSGEHNSQLTVGQVNNRTFVVRGKKIGVFKHTNEGKVKYATTIKSLGFKKMKGFKPKSMMLHDKDTKMILMNENKKHLLFSMDIEYGKIVEEWKVDDNIAIDHIAPKSKFSQMTGEQTLVGTSHNALFRIDPRMGGRGGNTMAENKQYASRTAFSDVVTTAAGQIAVASEKGDIRLFDTVGKVAKTTLTLPAMSGPILGIDVTANGRWIVATCKTYLHVIDALIGTGSSTGRLGFERSFPANAKPQPKRLQLRAEHAASMGYNISFTPARFNTGKGQEEDTIVTSSGRYVIAWDFEKVKKGKLDSYRIKRYEDEVVQDNFRDNMEIIVALSNDVLTLNKRNLKKLPRESLSRSNIVNSYY